MNTYEPKNIRNVVLLGHQGSGKTTLLESIALIGGLIKKKGTVEDGNTISDYLKEEKWIPVSEKLPEVRQWVLCQCKAGVTYVLRKTYDGDWEQVYPQVTFINDFVIAWMPLPKPYEEVISND